MILFLKILFKGFYFFAGNKYYRKFLWLVLFYSSRKRYKQIQLKVAGYHLLIADNLSFIWQFKELFADNIYCFASGTDKPLIYDCGSNIGLSCLYFKKLYPLSRIKAFEADPEIAAILKKNISKNNIKGVEIFDNAIWIKDEQINFIAEGADRGFISDSGSNAKMQVQAIRLRTLLEKEDHVNMLKMDVEGAETTIIEDCRDVLFKIDNIFIEYHSFNNKEQNLEKILVVLKENNFRYYIQAANNRKTPLINTGKETAMDFQANIFAYNNKKQNFPN